jgi:hypothetical protein
VVSLVAVATMGEGDDGGDGSDGDVDGYACERSNDNTVVAVVDVPLNVRPSQREREMSRRLQQCVSRSHRILTPPFSRRNYVTSS